MEETTVSEDGAARSRIMFTTFFGIPIKTSDLPWYTWVNKDNCIDVVWRVRLDM